jgi:hypothetical protein
MALSYSVELTRTNSTFLEDWIKDLNPSKKPKNWIAFVNFPNFGKID